MPCEAVSPAPESVLYAVRTMLRSAVAILVLVVMCVSCTYRRALIPPSPTRDPKADLQCFQACTDQDDEDDVACVARCPGAVASAQLCEDEDLCRNGRRLTPAAKVALTVGIVATLVAVVAVMVQIGPPKN